MKQAIYTMVNGKQVVTYRELTEEEAAELTAEEETELTLEQEVEELKAQVAALLLAQQRTEA